MQYTFNSTDENNFNRINVNIPNVFQSSYINVSVTNLTTNCAIRILNEKDFLVFEQDNSKLTVQFNDYTRLAPDSFAVLINEGLGEDPPISADIDNCQRIFFQSTGPFKLVTCTYNVKLLLGLYAKKDVDFPLEAEEIETDRWVLKIQSAGYFLSTPILYLISNIGQSAFRNLAFDISNIQSADIVMRINNSFTPSIPIIASNGEFSQNVQSGSIAGAWFLLVDADLHPIDLLNPMYISIQITEADVEFKLSPEEQKEKQDLILARREELQLARAQQYVAISQGNRS